MPKNRYLTVYEHDTSVPSGRFIAVSPNNASGVAIPSFRTVTALPAVGTTIGEALLDTNTGLSYVWDGVAWKSIVPPSIVAYADDNAVLTDTGAAAGLYAFSRTTGNLFVRFDSGGGALVWRQIGVRTYPTQAGLLADSPPDGQTGYAVDTQTIWNRAGAAWVPSSFVLDTAANIAALASVAGQIAFESDTHKFKAADGAGGWVGMPWGEYATEVALLADGPVDGTFAVALDTGGFFYRSAGAWVPGSRLTIQSGVVDPTTPAMGTLFHNTTDGRFKMWTGSNWIPISVTSLDGLSDVDLTAIPPTDGQVMIYEGSSTTWKPGSLPSTPIGTIEQSILTAAQFETALSAPEKGKWALMDGRDITGTDLATVTGNNKLPDMRGAFLRMAGTNAGNAAWVGGTLGGFQDDTTARPDTPFTTNNTGNHKHRHGKKEFGPQDELWVYGYDHNKLGTGWVSNNEAGHNQYLGFTETTGQHSHSINGGGDTETRPKNYSVNFFCKINGSTATPGGAHGPSGQPGPDGSTGSTGTTTQSDFMNYLGIIPPAQPVWDAYIYDAGGRTPVKGDVFMTVGAGTPDASWTGLSETPAGSLIVFDGTKWEVLTTPPPPPDDTVKNQWGAFKNANAMTFDDPPLPKIFLEKKIGTVLHLKTTVPDLAAGIAGNQPIPLEWDNDAGMAGGMNNVNDGDTIEVEGEAIGSGMNGKLLKKFVGTTNGLEVMGSIFGGVVMSPHDVNRNVRMIGAVPEGIQFPAAKPNSFYVDTSDPQNGVLKFMDENGVSRTVSLT